MRGPLAIYLKESIELAPVTLAGIVVGAWTASEFAIFDGMHLAQAGYIAVAALAMGAWHAVLDRRMVGNAFVLHRPASAKRAEAARWLAGWTTVTLIFVAFAVAKPIARSTIISYEELRVRSDIVQQQERYSYALMLHAYLLALLTWSTLRVTLSWRGLLAPLLFTLLLPAGIGTILGRGQWVAIVFIVACSVYQFARLTSLRKGGWA